MFQLVVFTVYLQLKWMRLYDVRNKNFSKKRGHCERSLALAKFIYTHLFDDMLLGKQKIIKFTRFRFWTNLLFVHVSRTQVYVCALCYMYGYCAKQTYLLFKSTLKSRSRTRNAPSCELVVVDIDPFTYIRVVCILHICLLHVKCVLLQCGWVCGSTKINSVIPVMSYFTVRRREHFPPHHH